MIVVWIREVIAEVKVSGYVCFTRGMGWSWLIMYTGQQVGVDSGPTSWIRD